MVWDRCVTIVFLATPNVMGSSRLTIKKQNRDAGAIFAA